jgi:hypothetical protein
LPGLLDRLLLGDTDPRQHRDHEVPLIEAEHGDVGQVPRNESAEESAYAKGIGTNHAKGVLAVRMTPL